MAVEDKGEVRMPLSTPSDATLHTPRMLTADAASMPLDAVPMPLDAGSPTVQRSKKGSSSTALLFATDIAFEFQWVSISI